MENQCIERSILNTIISAGAKAITDYLDMTGDAGAWATPEFWLKSEIARALMQEKKYYLYLEHRVSDLRRFANDGREIPLTLQGDRQAGPSRHRVI